MLKKALSNSTECLTYRLQTKCEYSKRWSDAYLFDNQQQCLFAMEDIEYAKWLTGQYCYVKDDVQEWMD